VYSRPDPGRRIHAPHTSCRWRFPKSPLDVGAVSVQSGPNVSCPITRSLMQARKFQGPVEKRAWIPRSVLSLSISGRLL
jgi:hypothetical protein